MVGAHDLWGVAIVLLALVVTGRHGQSEKLVLPRHRRFLTFVSRGEERGDGAREL